MNVLARHQNHTTTAHLSAAILLACLLRPAHAQDPYQGFIAQTSPGTPQEEQKLFHLPPGFEIQLFAAEPDVPKPMNLAFDARGRLWVTQSVEYPFPAKGDKPRDTVRILEDTDGDGRSDRVTVFADGLNIPIGVMPIRGGAIVYSIPNIYRLYDDDGDDHADRREVLYGPFGFRDTHGMINSFTRGFDGWLYACHGYSNTSKVAGHDGQTLQMQSGNTFRMRLDGSHLEAFTHGQVNPFGLCFDPRGNLYSADCHSRPIYMLLRGAYYPSFGKPHDGLGFGPEMCPHDHGSTAIAGIVYYAAEQFPAEYRGTVFTGNVVTNRINHDAVAWHGSTPLAVHRPDFLTCDDPWFRPVNIKLGPDGALYVADFYNRIIGHYEVPLDHPGRDHERGRIWRIVYRGDEPHRPAVTPRKDWTRATVAELIGDLGDTNLTVRMMAANELVDRVGKSAAGPVRQRFSDTANPVQRIHCLWVLERLGALDEELLVAAVNDPDAAVRTHAMKVLAERANLIAGWRRRTVAALSDSDPFVQRAAAEVLGRHPAAEGVPPLLQQLARVPDEDSQLRHVVRMALRDQLRVDSTFDALASDKLSDADRRRLADVALGVPSARAAEWLLAALQNDTVDPAARVDCLRHVARYVPEAELGGLYDLARKIAGPDLAAQAAVLESLYQGVAARGLALSDPTRRWAVQVAQQSIATQQAPVVDTGIALARDLKLRELRQDLTALATADATPEAQRRAALAALVAIAPAAQVPLLDGILTSASEPLPMRQHAAALLGQIQRPAAQAALAGALPTAPEQLAKVIALALSTSDPGAKALLDHVAAGEASARLLQDPLVHRLLDARPAPEIAHRLAELTQGLPAPAAALRRTITQRRARFAAAAPDAARGAKVFQNRCAACHRIGDVGQKIGPELDGIGVRGPDRILEDVLDPNQNVDQAFRGSVIVLTSGRVVTGLITSDEGELLTLVDAEGKEQRIPKADVDERTVTKLSPMPDNFADVLPEKDLYDLLAFLLSQRQVQGGDKDQAPPGQADAEGQKLPPHVAELLRWLPADTELMVVAQSFDIGQAAPAGDEQHPVAVSLAQGLPNWASLEPLQSLENGRYLRKLAGRKVAVALRGSRNFNTVSSFGSVSYEGCYVLVFEKDLADAGERFLADVRAGAKEVRRIAEHEVFVFDSTVVREPIYHVKEWEGTYLAHIAPDTLVCATSDRHLKDVLERRDGKQPRAALPDELPQWSRVDVTAPLWAVRQTPRGSPGAHLVSGLTVTYTAEPGKETVRLVHWPAETPVWDLPDVLKRVWSLGVQVQANESGITVVTIPLRECVKSKSDAFWFGLILYWANSGYASVNPDFGRSEDGR